MLAAAIGIALVVRIAFWAYTGRVWEDALITITHAQNAATGHGLIHHAGEGRVQGFTSALSVLVPLAGELIKHGAGLTALRLASLAAAVVTVIYAWRIATLLALTRAATAFVLTFLALDSQQIFFGMAGMETQMAVAILLCGVYYVMTEQSVKAGCLLGLALVVRPDFILWIAAALIMQLRHWPRSQLLRALGWMAAVGLPWFVFATAYYGSPIPETIRAKAVGVTQAPSLSDSLGTWISFLWHQPAQAHLAAPFTPFFEDWATIAAPLPWWLNAIAVVFLGLAVVGAWRVRAVRGMRALIGFVALYALYLLFAGDTNYYRWYMEPMVAAVALLAGAGLTQLTSANARRTAAGLALVLATAFVAVLPFDFILHRRVQTEIESHVREPLGRYMNLVVAPGQTVASESAGYLGYYAHVLLYDHPGLTSPHGLAAMRKVPRGERDFPHTAVVLQPDWIVARRVELDELAAIAPWMRKKYAVVAEFSVPESQSRLVVGPVVWANLDRDFVVLRRRGVKPASNVLPGAVG